MDKALLHKQIVELLDSVYQGAVDAAMLAYNTATHEENVAENKYDTLGLEASYLAQGQAQRVEECKADLAAFKALEPIEFSDPLPITIGALIVLMDDQGVEQYLFLGPAAGGLKFIYSDIEVTVITPSAPLGQALLGHFVNDEINMDIADQKLTYEIIAIY